MHAKIGAEHAIPTYPLPSQETNWDFSSYLFNNHLEGNKLNSIQHPVRTALAVEFPAIYGFSWHQPQSKAFMVSDDLGYLHPAYNNAQNEVSFVDGHVSYTKIYSDGKLWA